LDIKALSHRFALRGGRATVNAELLMLEGVLQTIFLCGTLGADFETGASYARFREE
jgi:hypothetical protein